RKITQYTRYGTLALALAQSLGIAIALEGQAGLVLEPGVMFRFVTVATLVTGTMFLMWLGEQITERGIGNGIDHHLRGYCRGVAECNRRVVRTGSHRCDASLHGAVHLHPGGAGDWFRGVRGAWPAQDPGELRKAAGWQQGVWRAKLSSAVEAEDVGCDSADLRLEHHPVSGDAGAVVRFVGRDVLAAGHRVDALSGAADLRDAVRSGDRVLLLLLHGAGVQCP